MDYIIADLTGGRLTADPLGATVVTVGDAYRAIMDMIGERVRSGSWTVADATIAGERILVRYRREYGCELTA